MAAANANAAPGSNRQVRFAARPEGSPSESAFLVSEAAAPRAGPGEALVQSVFLSIDAHVRLRLFGLAGAPPLPIGEVIPGAVVGRVVESNDPRWTPGDIVEGALGWQEYAAAHAKTLKRVDIAPLPIGAALYPLGLSGMAAYFGLLDVCKPQPGETVVVSGAAGAVGSLAGQIARIRRCRAVGIAGSAAKAEHLTSELHFDAAVNFHNGGSAALREACPHGIDVYFDNVGGEVTDQVVRLLNARARVAVCGQLSQYSHREPDAGPRWLWQLTAKQARVEGFQAQQFAARFGEAARQIATWIRDGRMTYHQEISDGLSTAPAALVDVLNGRTMGNRLVRLAD